MTLQEQRNYLANYQHQAYQAQMSGFSGASTSFSNLAYTTTGTATMIQPYSQNLENRYSEFYVMPTVSAPANVSEFQWLRNRINEILWKG